MVEDRRFQALVVAFCSALETMFAEQAKNDEELREHLADTPKRMAKAWLEMYTAEEPSITTFAAHGRSELLVERNIPFHSTCAHHMLPFVGHVTIGYIPNERIVGLSKFSRVVDWLASMPTTQERLTAQIADYFFSHSELRPLAVGVIVRAEHFCVHLRGAEKHGVQTATSALRGSFLQDAAQRSEFLAFCNE